MVFSSLCQLDSQVVFKTISSSFQASHCFLCYAADLKNVAANPDLFPDLHIGVRTLQIPTGSLIKV